MKEKEPEMVVIYIEEEISVIDATSLDEKELRYITLKPGIYHLSQIPNPIENKYGSSPWWVIDGTQHGMGIGGWKAEPAVAIIPNKIEE